MLPSSTLATPTPFFLTPYLYPFQVWILKFNREIFLGTLLKIAASFLFVYFCFFFIFGSWFLFVDNFLGEFPAKIGLRPCNGIWKRDLRILKFFLGWLGGGCEWKVCCFDCEKKIISVGRAFSWNDNAHARIQNPRWPTEVWIIVRPGNKKWNKNKQKIKVNKTKSLFC